MVNNEVYLEIMLNKKKANLYQIDKIAINQLYSVNETWLIFAITIVISSLAFVFIIFTLIQDARRTKLENAKYLDPLKMEIIEKEKAIWILNNKGVKLVKLGLILFLIQNISIILIFIIYLFVIFNLYYYTEIFDIILYLLLHLDIISAIVLLIGLIKTQKIMKENGSSNRLKFLWIFWIISAIIYRILLFTLQLESIWNNSNYHYRETIIAVGVPIFVLSTTLFYYSLFYSSKILAGSKIINNKWFLVIFSGINWIITNYFLIGSTIPYDFNHLSIWVFIISSSEFFFYIKIIGVPTIGIVSFFLTIKSLNISISKAKELFIKNSHDISILRQYALHPKNYLELNDPFITNSYENVINLIQFEDEQLEAFTQRAQDNVFLLIIPENYSLINTLVTQFLKISQVRPNLDFLILTDIVKNNDLNHNLKWHSDNLIPLVYEFDSEKLPAVFVLNNNGEEIAKIEGKIPKETDLLEGLIYVLDIGPVIKEQH